MATETTKLTYVEGAAASTPAGSRVVTYAKADGLMYSKDDAGVETLMSGGAGGGGVATDSIWDAAGDLVQGTGSNTAARLAKGAAGGALSIINAAVAWNSGTSNPGSAVAGDRFWRTDLGMEIFYDGTRWRSTQRYAASITAGALTPLSVSGTIWHTSMWKPTFDAYIIEMRGATYVSTTNNGTNFWTVALTKWSDSTVIDSFTTAADSASTTVNKLEAIGAVSTEQILYLVATKTLSPGTLYAAIQVYYQLVVT